MKKITILLLTFMFLTLSINAQTLGEPVYNFTSKLVINDSITIYEYIGYKSSEPDKEKYVTVNGLCVEVVLTYYGDYIERSNKVLKDQGYILAGYNLYYGPYGLIRSSIRFTGLETKVTFTDMTLWN